MMSRIGMAVTTLLMLAGSANAGDLQLGSPVACTVGRDCFVQNFFDHDPGPGRRDYACGRLSYDGHTGTDFRVPDVPAMMRGVTVTAAAPGTVKAVRDGMDDVNVREIGRAALGGKDAGNGVVIDHGDGWETQYSHLRRGSVAVRPQQKVEAGTHLGLIGMSGQAEFPHVELVVRRNGTEIDPFNGSSGEPASCGDTARSLWRPEVLAALPYQPTGGLIAGFATKAVKEEPARSGEYRAATLSDPPALVFWADVFGTLAGDEQRMSIAGPTGQEIHATTKVLDANNISWFAFSGLKRPPEGWPAGTYRGTYLLSRNGAEVVRLERTVELR